MNSIFRRKTLIAAIVIISFGTSAMVANATHSWGGYHWARTTNAFTLKLGDNVGPTWDTYLTTTSSDWSVFTVLDTGIVPGQGGRNCTATTGRVEVCNKKYGNNGWLGIASIWLSGTHIARGTVKLNDTYFATGKYNTTPWRNLVMCQEVGHTLGLDHQDEVFDNTNKDTCMDYTNDPSTNQHPNDHDYEELAKIYSHLDTTTTVGATTASKANSTDDPSSWGKEIRKDARGRSSLFERDLGNGEKLVTHVIWAS